MMFYLFILFFILFYFLFLFIYLFIYSFIYLFIFRISEIFSFSFLVKTMINPKQNLANSTFLGIKDTQLWPENEVKPLRG